MLSFNKIMIPCFMIKSLIIILTCSISIFANQIILVVADDFNSSKAMLERYEDGILLGDAIEVNIGRHGLGWGLSKIELEHNSSDPIKVEGDGKAPAGIFKLISAFGYEQNRSLDIAYQKVDKNLICVDDSNSDVYNQIVTLTPVEPKSYEIMRRDDHQYRFGVVVAHNTSGIKERGSCIFLHIQKSPDSPTAGCTAMSEIQLREIIGWLNIKKSPTLIQIPSSASKETLKLYPYLKKSKLLAEPID